MHLKSAAIGPHRLLCARCTRRLGGEPCPEEVESQLLVRGNAQVPLVDGDEDGRLRDGVGVEVVELHAIIVQKRSHEPVCWQTKTMLMKGHEAHNVAIMWPRL